ncbi:MAG: amidohydrolase family protein [Armatimonadota bacterium]|nr:amidohydrolase family protein [Armatimonadota bacterium]
MRISFEVVDANTMFGPSPTPAMDLSLDRLVQAIQNHGISRACTLSTVGICHNYVEGNAATAAACAGKPELIPVATIDPRGFFKSSDAPDKITKQGFRMFRLFPDEQDWPISYAPLTAILDGIEAGGAPVIVGVGRAGDASALLPLAKGRGNAFILTNVTFDGMAEAACVMAQAENIFLEIHSLQAPSALSMMVNEVGADRLIFGSGCPGASLAGALKKIQLSDVADGDKTKILSGNVKRLLGEG